ncbi:MAG: hypothetical protein R3257_00695 [bacterium]|nr:hypothetical protein [bacterium]
MNADLATNPGDLTQPPTEKKKGCGCCLSGCLVFLGIFVIFTVGGTITFWYGMTNLSVPDPVVQWAYENVVRPKIVENLPPNVSPQQKKQILQAADFGVERYLNMPDSEKRAILKEAMIAGYYYSRNQVIPPEKIPNLMQFIQDTQRALQR